MFLTAAGKRLKRRAMELPAAMLSKAKLSIAELEKLRSTLQQLTRCLHASVEE